MKITIEIEVDPNNYKVAMWKYKDQYVESEIDDILEIFTDDSTGDKYHERFGTTDNGSKYKLLIDRP